MAQNGAAKTSSDQKQVRLMLLCAPRSTSTIFTKCLSRIPDTEVFMDVHYFCHEAEYNLTKVMGKAVDYDGLDEDWRQAAQLIVGEDCSGDKVDVSVLKFPVVKKALDNPKKDKKFVLCKTISVPITGRYEYLPDKSSNYRYSIILRNPIKVFTSWRRAAFDVVSTIPTSAMKNTKTWENFHFIRDVPEKYNSPGRFFKELHEIWVYVKKNLDPSPVIIESDELLTDPAGMLAKYCAALDLPYSDDLLKWEGNPEEASDWIFPFNPIDCFELSRIVFKTALHSNGFFSPPKVPSLDDVTDDVRESVEFVKPYYDEMYNARIKPYIPLGDNQVQVN